MNSYHLQCLGLSAVEKNEAYECSYCLFLKGGSTSQNGSGPLVCVCRNSVLKESSLYVLTFPFLFAEIWWELSRIETISRAFVL